MNRTKQLIFAALCTAMGIVLPVALHIVPRAGHTLLPMHIPVLLCGFLCTWQFALLCGIATPVLSCLLTAMPSFIDLPAMTAELALYAVVPALILRALPLPNNAPIQKQAARTYIALITAMLAGRLVYGLLRAFIFRAGAYSLQIWVTAAFVTALPGILVQLILIPILVITLRKIRL